MHQNKEGDSGRARKNYRLGSFLKRVNKEEVEGSTWYDIWSG